jgi:predicted dehydrogenase
MSTSDSVMYTGDLEPSLEITLSGREPVDATTVPVRIIGTRGGVIVIDQPPTTKTLSGDTTVLTYQWQSGDTATPGPIEFEVEVMWPGNRPQTFESCNRVVIKKDADA